ncbi:MAG: alpha/beta hydrolase [Fimbriimonadaceae bacterium]
MIVTSNIEFREGQKGCLLDLFVPEGTGPNPTLLLIHGGGWISGEKETFHDEARYFASQGIASACIGYRLAPLNPFPAASDDVLHAVAFLRKNAKQYNLDPNTLVSFGNSAGGHLSCIAGLQRTLSNGDPAENVNASVAICPITDIRNPDQTQYPISMSFLEQFMDCSFAESPEKYSVASPMTHIHEKAPPFLIFHGEADDIVPPEQSKNLYINLQQAGVSAELHILEGEGHSFTMNSWLQIREQTLEFVQTL